MTKKHSNDRKTPVIKACTTEKCKKALSSMLCAEKKKSINWRRKNEKKKQQQRGSNVEKWILCERNWKKGKKVMSPRRKVEKEKRKTLKQCGEKEMQV